MRWRMRGAAVTSLATAMGLMSEIAAADPSRNVPEQALFLVFSGADLWRHGGFAHVGVFAAPAGVDRDGPVFKLLLGSGLYQYRSDALGDITGKQVSASLLPGWRFVNQRLTATVFAGPDLQDHRLTPNDPSATIRGLHFGARLGGELWYQPSDHMMIAADASISTIGTSYNARLAGGWRFFDEFFAGPEIQAFATGNNYRQWRAGVHVTGFHLSGLEWSAGLGFATDSDDRSGAYGKVGVLARHRPH